MKIALCQINTTVGDFEGNVGKILDFAGRARAAGADLAVFPELTLTSYHPKDLLESVGFVEANLASLDALLPASRDIALVVGHVAKNPSPDGKALMNAAALLEGGKVAATAYKTLLPTYDVFDETRHFQPARAWKPAPFMGTAMGLTICEDVLNDKAEEARNIYKDDPPASLVRAGAKVLVNLSASPFHLGKPSLREAIVARLAKRLCVPVVHVNQVGGNDELLFDGSSFAADPSGKIVVRLKSFEEDMAVFSTASSSEPTSPLVQEGPETVRRALVMGIRDYMAKCGFSEVV
ncbi:MAG: nitrilase-related carbon-nitrogen hydrolase, partial [Planctomycetota bacterium]